MSQVDVLIDELRRGHDGDAWHGSSTRRILEDVTAEEAAARPVPGAHTIWEIVLHMTAWTDEVARRLRTGEGGEPEARDWPSAPAPGGPAWRETLSAHARAHTGLLAALAAFPEARLLSPFGSQRDPAAGTGVSFTVMLHGLAQHDAYHSGQVSLLKKALRRP